MTCYKILNTTFLLSDYELLIDGQMHEIKLTTLKALRLFLTSQGEIISKDMIIKYVWGTIIVSDASAFKQAQAVKKLLIFSGLPKDILENIYGKGYRLTYKVIELETGKKEDITRLKPAQILKNNRNYYLLFAFFIFIISGFYYYNNSIISQVGENILNTERRSSIEELMQKNWSKGLQQVQEFLNQKDEKLSQDDVAYLYLIQGEILRHLQEFEKSVQSSTKALLLYEKSKKIKQQGIAHLNLAKSYELNARVSGNKAKMQKHIQKSMTLFKDIGANEKLIDSQMFFAHHMKKYANYEKAIKLYEEIINNTDNANNKVAKMMAVNNLAATYQVLNQFDKATELGEIGLQLTLEIGKGSYIASSYSFLSDLYQNQYQSKKAMQMIEQAIKYQLSTNDFSRLSPKLVNLNFLLVQTYQFEKASELNIIINEYANSLGKKGYLTILLIYQGLNEARQNHWQLAEQLLFESLIKLNQLNSKYKKPLNQAYLALVQQFDSNHLNAIENAMEVLGNSKTPKQTKAIAALALAYSYEALEKRDLSNKWYNYAQKELNPKWLFEYQLFLKLKLERENQVNSILIAQTQKEIVQLSKQIQQLPKDTKVNEEIFTNLKDMLDKKIIANNKSRSIQINKG